MRLLTLLKAAVLSLLLSACVAPMLAMGQGQLMWALLKPMVGLDPNTTNLFEQPVIKTRMTGLLGPHYDTTVNLLRTATELQQEGPLFYLASRYSPLEGPERAGLVWNSETNQMAALLNTGEQTKVFTESHTGRAAVWPAALQDWLNHNTAPAMLPLAGPETNAEPRRWHRKPCQPASAAATEPPLSQLQAELAASQRPAAGGGTAIEAAGNRPSAPRHKRSASPAAGRRQGSRHGSHVQRQLSSPPGSNQLVYHPGCSSAKRASPHSLPLGVNNLKIPVTFWPGFPPLPGRAGCHRRALPSSRAKSPARYAGSAGTSRTDPGCR
jgi:hypothetical protein